MSCVVDDALAVTCRVMLLYSQACRDVAWLLCAAVCVRCMCVQASECVREQFAVVARLDVTIDAS